MTALLHKARRGQAMTEFIMLSFVLLVGVGGILAFAPDMFAAMTIYIRGFFITLGYPVG